MLCFRNFPVAKKFLDKRGGGVSTFSVSIFRQIFCLTVPKSFVGESFTVALISGTEKVWIKEGGSIKIFRQIFFVSKCRNFRRGIFYSCIIFGYRKSLDRRGGITFFRRKVFVSLYQNISLENTLVLQKNSLIENFHA